MSDTPEPLLQFFSPPFVSEKLCEGFHGLAKALVIEVPRSPERTVALRKLIEAMDAMTRANSPFLRPHAP